MDMENLQIPIDEKRISPLLKIEKAEVWITFDKSLNEEIFKDGRAVRGFFGNLFANIPEFHGHDGNKFLYSHPLIQYKIFGGSALIVGIKEGAYLLKALPQFEFLELHHEKYPVIKQVLTNDTLSFGMSDGMKKYRFIKPWIALNEDNHEAFLSCRELDSIKEILNRILIGNILSVSKAFGYIVDSQIKVKSNISDYLSVEVKKGLNLLSFNGEFDVNFLLPDFWGIGKFSSRGYGTLKRL
ncbi:MAG: CRISPR-associated endonuclease Cas6 [Candidatus Xenobiia bacterium LiM19]